MFEKTLDYFISTQSPWAVLFVLLFSYTIITNARRERERRAEVKDIRDSLEAKMNSLLQNTSLMLETWKLIIERELERREGK